jgi:hypothetical protein
MHPASGEGWCPIRLLDGLTASIDFNFVATVNRNEATCAPRKITSASR